MARRNRSVSVPEELDARIAAAAAAEGLTVSAWLVRSAERELVVRAGLAAVAEWEAENGAFSDEELADARTWAGDVIARAQDLAATGQVPASA